MDAEIAANWPHVPTATGRLVKVKNREGQTFRVVASWVAYQDAKARNAYVVVDTDTEQLWVILNGWLTPFEWVNQREQQLLAAQNELTVMGIALGSG
ncbi:hypothetical protein HLB42_21525 (plasmid) [Deinococcus sp. D7000]|nr:hypothetical protein HLB42_13800 [Deinococcus sp. D7000]QLG13522.1 hypothetical protein HLB42_21525 [Deinococcus sp. D7000]